MKLLSTNGPWRVPLHLLTGAVILGLVFTVAGVLTWRSYRGTEEALTNAANESIEHIQEALSEKIRRVLEPAESQLALLAHSPLSSADDLAQRLIEIPLASDVLASNDLIDAFYVGYPNGEFILFRPLKNAADRDRFDVPEAATMLVQTISETGNGRMLGEFRAVDQSGNILMAHVREDYRFDPRQRPWYLEASRSIGAILTDPYVFSTTGMLGRTLARLSSDNAAVIGLDLRSGVLSEQLGRLRITPASELAVIDDQQRVIAYSGTTPLSVKTTGGRERLPRLDELDIPALAAAKIMIEAGKDRDRATIMDDTWQLISADIAFRNVDGLKLVMVVPDREFLAGARAIVWRQLLIAAVVLALSLPVVWWATQRMAKSLRQLVKETNAISNFDFRQERAVSTVISEVSELDNALGSLKRTIRQFLEIGTAMAAEREFRPLLDRVLREILGLVGSDGGAVFLVDEDTAQLKPAMVRWGELSSRVGDIEPDSRPLADSSFPNVHKALETGRIQLTEIDAGMAEIDRLGLRAFVEKADFANLSVITVPLHNRNGAALGVLALVKGLQRGSAPWQVGKRMVDLIRAVSASASVAIENKHLLDAQKRLIDALIQLVAGAIDAKSPYTAGHCTRVPALTKMLAQEACAQDSGPFAAFNLTDEEWEAVHVASWLHDCGKVTTPEYVVDKATKLETIYDRIHEIRTRFEVLKRDAELAYWRGLARGEDAAALEAEWHAERRSLDEDFAFIAACNAGGEFMAPELIDRLKRIAGRTWTRTLSDRLGLSFEELARKNRVPEPSLPVQEPLLADRHDHIIEREGKDALSADNPWGFRMDAPTHKYNRGEIHNLSISRGTLTDEERYRINDHIVQTIIMLKSLPFPAHLKSVPEIAGGHHEKMDGTGYPKRLTRDEMSPVARMMAVADVFEALTAADRPYKSAKKLSEAIKIMGFMKKDRHLDPDILDMFLSTGIWRRYAEQFLSAAQMDEPDIDAILRIQPADAR